MKTEFKAHCRIVEMVDGKPTGCGVPVGLDFTDPAEFDAHMDQVHGRKLGMVYIGYEPPRVHEGKFATKRKTLFEAAPGPTRPPGKNPKPFTPKPLQPGADVTWKELVSNDKLHPNHQNAWVTRTGQVWSLGWNAAVWVVPYLPWRNELAVLLKPHYGGRELHVVQVCTRTFGIKDAA